MIIKGITFDLEGTCVNLEIAHHMAHIKAAAAVGVYLDIRSSIASLPHFIGGPDEEVAREIYDLSDKKEPASSILARKRHFYDQLVEGEKIEPRPGLIEILEELKGAGFKMAIGSVTPNQQAEIILAKSGLIGHFDRKNIILGNDIKGRHSKSDIFAETARRMGIKPDEQLVFDDSPHGILSARSNHSLAIAMPIYNRPEATVPLAKAGAMRIFMDWREIKILVLIKIMGETNW